MEFVICCFVVWVIVQEQCWELSFLLIEVFIVLQESVVYELVVIDVVVVFGDFDVCLCGFEFIVVLELVDGFECEVFDVVFLCFVFCWVLDDWIVVFVDFFIVKFCCSV